MNGSTLVDRTGVDRRFMAKPAVRSEALLHAAACVAVLPARPAIWGLFLLQNHLADGNNPFEDFGWTLQLIKEIFESGFLVHAEFLPCFLRRLKRGFCCSSEPGRRREIDGFLGGKI